MKKRTFQIGPGVDCDIDRLISTRLLVQANSGGGKSFTLRRLLEQTHGAVQQIVLDPEGEFASLRESFDYVLAARQGGDTLADPRTAKLLAERLLELGVSAIIDIYELNPHERIRFVKLFLEALVDAPKNLWHPVLVVIDEAHTFCPEKEQAESSGAVKALCSRGRKRGFCAVLATQRLSKLAKDAAAECNNKLIGRTSLDVDMARAGDELGFTKPDRLVLRDLEDGEFFAFGPAMTRAVTKVKVGPVKTRHPEAGSKLAAVVPPPTDKVKALLPKLSDLPAEAEARERTVADLKKELATVRREITDVKRTAGFSPSNEKAKPEVEPKRINVLTDADRALLVKTGTMLEQMAGRLGADSEEAYIKLTERVQHVIVQAVESLEGVTDRARKEFAERLGGAGFQKILGKLSTYTPTPSEAGQSRTPPAASQGRRVAPAAATSRPASLPPNRNGDGDTSIGNSGLRRMLIALAQRPQGLNRRQLGVRAALSSRSGTFDTYLSKARTNGWIEGAGDLRITETGIAALGSYEPLPEGADLLAHWIGELGNSGAARILNALAGVYPRALTRAELGEAATLSDRSGTFDTYLSKLRTLELIEGRGELRASAELFS